MKTNPMLGHRGCRLCITYPEILEMQVRAIIEAAIDCQKRGIKVLPEIMHPLTMDKKELKILDDQTRKVAEEIISRSKVKLEYLVGTMIELPRAAIARGSNRGSGGVLLVRDERPDADCMGLSRDDAGRFLPDYVDERKAGIFPGRPISDARRRGRGHAHRMGDRARAQNTPEI